ncbi:hypothetical protein [Lacticaseibacillus paracasei]|uniref:hypothetical protein n=1 Tax=Lacticaseibacillus paracasei TaxID=1597 RepID=UPI0013A5765D|nr:hypothetical protein [Lacticaseibacillus paracasei]
MANYESILTMISVFVSAYSVYSTIRFQKKQNSLRKSEFNQRNNIEKAKIDANLKSSSRIHWIQEVRVAAVNFISSGEALLDYVNSSSDESITINRRKTYHKNMMTVIKCSNVLTLFFGYKTSYFKDKKMSHSDIMKKLKSQKNNVNVNLIMVTLFEEMSRLSKDGISRLGEGYVGGTDIKDIFNQLPENYFSDVSYAVSRYLKIEWDRAKNGD